MKMGNNDYRTLTEKEVEILKQQACFSNNWQLIRVIKNFKTENIRNVCFMGKNYLGLFNKEIINKDGVKMISGIYNSTISNCVIDNNVYINNVRQYISNYSISENVIINNIDLLATTKDAIFGNGVEVTVLNEAGGREIKIFNELSSHIAYLMVCYRHKKYFIKKLNSIIESYSDNIKSDIGIIAENSIIQNCGTIRNVNIGEYADLNGLSSLENGSIISKQEDPVIIGNNVIAKDFIIKEGSVFDGAAIITKCFIGQACFIGKQISAENSLFFANSEAFHGEALSVFAGPYTVSHHKSTLLIAAMYSFYNAGSGTNKSNHMYRLGPVHQGILERGCKTGSFFYMIWPSHVGAFSSIIGKHSSKFDSSDFPFSYISEKNGLSKIAIGLNFFNAGTWRDKLKWPKRDKRKIKNKTDLIIFNTLSPYTIKKVINGLNILEDLEKNQSIGKEYIEYQGINIKLSQISSYKQNYELIITKYLGEKVIQQLSESDFKSSFIRTKTFLKNDRWADIAGLIAPCEEIDRLIEDIENDSLNSIETINRRIKHIYTNYEVLEWQWVLLILEKRFKKETKNFITDDIKQLILELKEINKKFTELVLKDAKKEFNKDTQIGYGFDGNESTRHDDFLNVRGSYQNNNFVKQMEAELINSNKLADTVIGNL
ncbi:DUF4954 family protein [Bacteroidota bacterium]